MIILGSVTIAMGIICVFFLIDSPKSSALGLNAEQELLVEERTKDNATVRTTEIKKEQIWEALKELRFWCFCGACVLINLQNGAMTIYNAQITESFGFNVRFLNVFFILFFLKKKERENSTFYLATAIHLTYSGSRWFDYYLYWSSYCQCTQNTTNDLYSLWIDINQHHWTHLAHCDSYNQG